MRSVFISYATSDRKEALALCEAIERRGVKCWIACRDVRPGENYQEAIVKAIRAARAMVLVFSDRANNSDEIKKEMSLVSRFHVPMLALRIEDVEPSDAFAYELATRQWIDLFEDWDKSIDALIERVEQLAGDDVDGAESAESPAPRPAAQRTAPPPPPPALAPKRGFKAGSLIAVAAAIIALVAIGAASWFFLRGSQARADHPMEVRWTGFQTLSPDLPRTMPTALRDETIAAFSDDGVVGVSTAPAPPPGDAPAYALGGTVRRDGDKIRVIARLVNERSGTTLWSNDFSYDAADETKIPRRFAIRVGNFIRCGLFGASTYPKALPDPVLTNYLQVCHNSGMITSDPEKAQDAARKVVAAAPDFSWGWSGLGNALGNIAEDKSPDAAKPVLAEAIAAEDKAVAIDPSNSQALSDKSLLIDQNDLQGREALLKQSLKARALACGCEHHIYGSFLQEVGRNADAIDEYRRSVAVLALNPSSQFALGDAWLEAGQPREAKPYLDATIELFGSAYGPALLAIYTATASGDYAAAAKAIRDPGVPFPPNVVAAMRAAFDALASGNAAAKAAAVPALAALATNTGFAINAADLIAALGANGDALKAVETGSRQGALGIRAVLFNRSFAAARADPAFPGVADRLGLTRYWKATHIKPDFCKASNAPAYCKTL